MGPRPIGRGIVNGLVHLCPSRSKSFNGAASDRTRNRLALGAVLSSSTALQWGRVRSDAESCNANTRFDLHMASMGPRPMDAESPRPVWVKIRARNASMGPRPIGRGIDVVNGTAGTIEERFNGAASDRTRNPRLHEAHVITKQASMGPRPMDAESWHAERLQADPNLASMGPRPMDAESSFRACASDCLRTLQWGRVRSDAES